MTQQNTEIFTSLLDDYILHVQWSSGGQHLVSGDSSGMLQVFDVFNREVVHEWQAHDGMLNLDAAPNQAKILTGGQDGRFKLWNLDSFSLLADHPAHSAWVECTSWSPTGKYAAVGAGPRITLIDSSGQLIYQSERHESTVSSICWHPDGQSFATACFGGVRIFGLAAEEPIQTMPWKNSMLSMSWSPDGKFIGCGTQDSRIHFFPLPYQFGDDFEMSGYQGKVKVLEWDTRAELLVTNCWSDIVVWRFAGHSPAGQVPWTIDEHQDKITAIRFQNQGSCFVSADEGGNLRFFQGRTDELICYGAYRVRSSISSLAWSPNDLFLAIGTTEGEIIVMRTPTASPFS
jgi:WD40 repeat protein